MSLISVQICSWRDDAITSLAPYYSRASRAIVVTFIKTLSQIRCDEISREKIHKFSTIACSRSAIENSLRIVHINVSWNTIKRVFSHSLYRSVIREDAQRRWCVRGNAHTIPTAHIRSFSTFCIDRPRKNRWERAIVIWYHHVQVASTREM